MTSPNPIDHAGVLAEYAGEPQQHGVALVRAVPTAVQRPDPLLDAVNALGQVVQLAKTLLDSGFLPRAIKTEAQAVAVMLTGREMGIGPMQAIRSVNIIDAKPVVAADLQLALFKRAGGRSSIRVDDDGAFIALRHPNGDEVEETYTMNDAKAAGLLGKDNWRKHPKAMLRSRVITAALKSIGFEATTGVYDPDEADHFSGGGSEAPTVRPPVQATARVAEDTTPRSSSAPQTAASGTAASSTPTATVATGEHIDSSDEDTARTASRYAARFPYAPHKGVALDAVEDDTEHSAFVIDDEALERCGQWCAQKLADTVKPAKQPDKLKELGRALDDELRRRSELSDLAASGSAGV